MRNEKGQAGVGFALVIGGIVALVAFIIVLMVALPTYHRYQKRQNANNNVKVYTNQLAVARIQAKIRYEQSIGVREAQDEIAKTLTPLYVSYEMTQAMQAIATSGQNNTVIYIPTDPRTGLPVIPTSNTAGK